MSYTVKKITVKDLNPTLLRFIANSSTELNEMYDFNFNWAHKFPLKYAIETQVFLICYKAETPVGMLVASLQPAFFDTSKRVLKQQTLFSKHPRATYELLRYFIDFGRLNANLVVTNIGKHTNLKPESLKKLGFTKMEEVFSLEA